VPVSHEFPADGSIAPERWYGEKLGHLSRHDQVALLRDEVETLCGRGSASLNAFAVRKSFLNAGGKEEHWSGISERISALHPRPSAPASKPVLRIAEGPSGDNGKARSRVDDSYKRLGSILVERGAITKSQLERACQQQLRTGERLGSILVGTGTIDAHDLAQALASQTGLLAVDLDRFPIDPKAVELIPTEVCDVHCMLPIKAFGEVVMLAMGNPSDADAYTASREAIPDKRIRRVVAAEIQIEKILQERKGGPRSRR